jgi:hypothetical protein
MVQDHLMTRPLRLARAILLTASMELGRSAHRSARFFAAPRSVSVRAAA